MRRKRSPFPSLQNKALERHLSSSTVFFSHLRVYFRIVIILCDNYFTWKLTCPFFSQHHVNRRQHGVSDWSYDVSIKAETNQLQKRIHMSPASLLL